jgi:hypothetical protein
MQTPGPADFDFSTMSAPVEGGSSWPPAARWAAGCGIGCGVLVLLEAVVLWIFIAVGFNLRPTEGVQAKVTVPPSVTAGTKFPLTLTVRNRGSQPFTLTNVIVRPRATQGLKLENPQPPPTAPPTDAFGTAIVWPYDKSIRPGGTYTVRLDAAAAEAGTVKGSLELQIGWAPKQVPFTVKVRPVEKPK